MNQDDSSRVLPFPWSRAAPPHSPAGAKDLGIGRMAQRLGVGDTHLNGHWCSRCQGIWYGLMLETECPACGNRRG
ncbi:MAG: hypothetical protein BGP10_01700 [Rhodanobacter sp. 68-29]|uniref:hypothetical protein n=1 Tax=Rhodanobacter sp. PCA2 TaxID=2006117 RepID=UPI00086B9AB5|nr:hypothetical protein [Rhodanobacter sp. PCA2]MBA2078373.1 hypothetical protein [Rhodanobacter sp. PCA2]MBN8924771.1 hypothetical protein [Rhodanobacter sp.]ODU74720.1 MAG: hypothetical protein ABT17_07085 [Rhodanobacter sp. SCN 69-32]OJY57548.1 MAG: hypothetical protein BGP10_01700 [Rhodanobacter sp. 68-29]